MNIVHICVIGKAQIKKNPIGGYLIDPIATNLWLKEFSNERFNKDIQHESLFEKTLNISSEC